MKVASSNIWITQCVYMYLSVAQFKLDIYMHVTLELFNKFVKLLASYMRVHDTIS